MLTARRQGWFIRLVAVVCRLGPDRDRFGEVLLTLLRDGGDIRLFNGLVSPRMNLSPTLTRCGGEAGVSIG